MNSNYSAVVVRITNLTKHPNADRLQLTNIYGNTVIVGLDTKENDLGVFFPIETQISTEFATANDLIRRKDENGKAAGGMLEENRRVRAIKLRGTPSMGLFLPLSSLQSFTNGHVGDEWITEGHEFTEYMGTPICQKYIPRTNTSNGAGGKPKEGRKPRESKIIPDQFRFHFDTAQLGRNLHKISPDDQVVITWKMHGTSAIVSNCLVKKKLNLISKLVKVFGVEVKDSEYDYIYASRRVIKNEFAEAKQHYYGTDLWSEIGKEHFESKLHKGETVYYEIVGYTKDGGAIQKDFDYRCSPDPTSGWPQHKVYVYRITQTSVDGSVVELQWNQVKERSKEIGVETVPEIFYGKGEGLALSKPLFFDMATIPEGWNVKKVFERMGSMGIEFIDSETESTPSKTLEWIDAFFNTLKSQFVYDQDSKFCHNVVPEEGICVRKEGLNIEVFKLKNFRFLEGETKSLDAGEVDTETAQSETF